MVKAEYVNANEKNDYIIYNTHGTVFNWNAVHTVSFTRMDAGLVIIVCNARATITKTGRRI